MEKQEQNSICREIGARTGGDIYIGVVGPVRSGKSTFIKRFMEQLVLPAMSGSAAARERARDELPQSAAGRTIMTTEWWRVPWGTRRTQSPAWSKARGLSRRCPLTLPQRPAPAR